MANLAPIFDWRKALIYEGSPLSANARFVGLVCHSYMSSEHMLLWPSVDTLAVQCSVSRRSITRGLRELLDEKYLTRVSRPGRSSIYVATMPAHALAYLNRSLDPGHAREYATGDSPPDGGWVTSDPGGGSPMAHEELREEPKNNNHAAMKKKGGGEHRLIFGAICEVMGRPPQGGEGAVWGRVAKLMAQAQVPPEEVVIRGNRMKQRWSSIPPSPMGLWNNWGQFAEGAGGGEVESVYARRAREDEELHAEVERLKAEGVIPREPGQG